MYSTSVCRKKLYFTLHTDTSQFTMYIQTINEGMLNKDDTVSFLSEPQIPGILSNRHIFPIRKFSDTVKFEGGRVGTCPSPSHNATGSWWGMLYVTLLPERPATQIPLQIPVGYPGAKIPESPSVVNCRLAPLRNLIP